ncbi:MAG: cytochrome P460 family protein [Acidobacteriia bacterium]|nr:cytochrome P460 family protein [Terriglobia bacterium]
MKKAVSLAVLILAAAAVLALNALSSETVSGAPRFNDKGELLPPEDYRDWVYLTSGLNMSYTENGRRAGPAGETDEPLPFDNVFVEPSAYREFKRTGTWPDHTMFVIEIRSSKTKVHPNQSGWVQGDVVGMPAAVKDVKRFGDKKWGYFSLMSNGKPTPSQAMPADHCWNCHNANGAVDNTFVQFYPTLKPIAEEKGTYKKTGPGQ